MLRLAAIHCNTSQQETGNLLWTKTEITGLPSTAPSTTTCNWWKTCDQPEGKEQEWLLIMLDKRGTVERTAYVFAVHLSPLPTG